MIIIINGSRNSGKTTATKGLVKLLNKTANIEIDVFRHFLPFLSIDETIRTNLENAVLVTKNFVGKGYNVILNYCFRKEDYEYLIVELRQLHTDIFTFTLKPELGVALSNRTGDRSLSLDDIQRIQDQYTESKHQIAEEGMVIDNTNTTPEEVVRIILENLNIKK